MSEVICISFTPSHEYREHIHRRYMNERSCGATAGDSYWLGLGTYDVVDPFARYREHEESKPITVPAWRERIEKAKRDIEKHKSEQRVQLLAEQLTDETIFLEIEAIRQWARSLLQPTRSETGLRELTQAGTN
jgi:hypothetical protein